MDKVCFTVRQESALRKRSGSRRCTVSRVASVEDRRPLPFVSPFLATSTNWTWLGGATLKSSNEIRYTPPASTGMGITACAPRRNNARPFEAVWGRFTPCTAGMKCRIRTHPE